jgi:hypothetical protein
MATSEKFTAAYDGERGVRRSDIAIDHSDRP